VQRWCLQLHSCCSSRSQQGVHHCHSSRHNHVCPWLFRSWSFQNQLWHSDDQKHIVLWHFGDCFLQLFVPVFLVRFVGWRVTQNDCKLAVFGVEASFYYPITDRFPFQQGVGLLLRDYKGYTTDMCVSLCPEYSIVEPSWVTCRPDLVHRHSLTPRMSSLYIFISRMTCANFKVSFIVRTFHAPMLMLVLGPSRLSVAHLPSWRRLSAGVVILPGWLKSAMGPLVVVSIVVVSVTIIYFMGWGC